MARKLRIEYPGAIYHLMSLGDHGEQIFRDDADRKSFLDTIRSMPRATKRAGRYTPFA